MKGFIEQAPERSIVYEISSDTCSLGSEKLAMIAVSESAIVWTEMRCTLQKQRQDIAIFLHHRARPTYKDQIFDLEGF